MSSDSLVLKFVEYEADSNDKTIDTIVYVFYDFLKNAYGVRGKRTNVKDYNFPEFSFYCDEAENVFDFIDLIVSRNKFSMILSNFKNLPVESDYITYKYLSLHDSKDRTNEITGYDKMCIKKDELNSICYIDYTRDEIFCSLNLIKSLYNPYFPEDSDDCN